MDETTAVSNSGSMGRPQAQAFGSCSGHPFPASGLRQLGAAVECDPIRIVLDIGICRRASVLTPRRVPGRDLVGRAALEAEYAVTVTQQDDFPGSQDLVAEHSTPRGFGVSPGQEKSKMLVISYFTLMLARVSKVSCIHNYCGV
jgi:hypothetical protein